MALYDSERGYLFCGDFAMSGLPDRLDNAQAYLVSMDRLAELPSQRVLPNRGRSYTRGRLAVTRAARFINNFLTNAPSVLVQGPTVLEFIERDRGHIIDNAVDLLFVYDVFYTLFEELVRTRTIAAEGEGLRRRYGVDVEDPRKRVRRL
jgi:glyoxylase-like metal-dependent hydrolase (beta-lactamase superfamily II)